MQITHLCLQFLYLKTVDLQSNILQNTKTAIKNLQCIGFSFYRNIGKSRAFCVLLAYGEQWKEVYTDVSEIVPSEGSLIISGLAFNLIY